MVADFGPAQVEAYLSLLKTASGENMRNTDLVAKAIEFTQKNAPPGWKGIDKKKVVVEALEGITKDTRVPMDRELVNDLIDTVIGIVKRKQIDTKMFIRHKESIFKMVKSCFTGCKKV